MYLIKEYETCKAAGHPDHHLQVEFCVQETLSATLREADSQPQLGGATFAGG